MQVLLQTFESHLKLQKNLSALDVCKHNWRTSPSMTASQITSFISWHSKHFALYFTTAVATQIMVDLSRNNMWSGF